MILILPPALELAALVKAYWFIEDLPGQYSGLPIRTCPVPFAVLSVNIGRANAAEDGQLVPDVSYLGLQSRSRVWHSWPDTYFVMAMLTIPGVVRLFPHIGSGSAGLLLELAALTGEASARSLKNGIGIEQEPQRIATFLDQWLISRMGNSRSVSEDKQIAIAHSVLRNGGTVETAASAAQMNRRQLHRLFQRHLGLGPKEIADLERLHASIMGAQSGRGEPVLGFSDQAHQIRSWKQRLGVTPGAYARAMRTPPMDHINPQSTISGIAYYL